MAQSVTLYNLLISCPGDIKDEITLIESAVDEFNELYTNPLGITIKTSHWNKSSYAQSEGKPQALLNEQFVNKCDAAVAIFWTRFGSPTDTKGSSEEIKKYRQIKKLHETISKALEWATVEKAFSDMHCLRLAVQNCGRAIAEDIEISFEIPRESLLTLNEFPQFENDEMGYLLNDCEMSVLFGIDGTAEYIEYSESKKSLISHYSQHSYGLPGHVPDYSDDFLAELNDIFYYSIYPSGDNYIVKLKVDYIKHNTSVAFPSILLVKDKIIEIPYKITSKNNPDVVKGVLKVQDFNV